MDEASGEAMGWVRAQKTSDEPGFGGSLPKGDYSVSDPIEGIGRPGNSRAAIANQYNRGSTDDSGVESGVSSG